MGSFLLAQVGLNEGPTGRQNVFLCKFYLTEPAVFIRYSHLCTMIVISKVSEQEWRGLFLGRHIFKGLPGSFVSRTGGANKALQESKKSSK